MKDMFRAQQQAKQAKKKLKKIQIEAEENGVVVVVSAEQEILSVQIPNELCSTENKAKLEKSILTALQRAMKKAQQIAAEEMKDVMGSLGLGM